MEALQIDAIALDLTAAPILLVALIFTGSAAIICVAGTRLARLADIVADLTGLGEAIVGAVLLGATTSLAGIVTSVWVAAKGHPELAAANAIGGIAAQTAFLALADMVYRRANLEHAAASPTILTQLVFLVILLTIPLVGYSSPEITITGIHPATPVLLVVYVAGLRFASGTHAQPMWQPLETSETKRDIPDMESARGISLLSLGVRFAGLALVVSIAGWLVAKSGIQISQKAGLSESIVGALMTATATSLPELVTTLAAVRRGALQLALGGIIGGNGFDVLFIAFSDVAYRDGSLYHAMGMSSVFWFAISILMSGVLLLGLIHREKHGLANIGFESVALLALYGGAICLQIYRG